MLRAGLCSAVAAFAAALILCRPSLQAQHEVRALWVVRPTLTSPSAIATMVDAAKAGSRCLSQVRGAVFSTSGQ